MRPASAHRTLPQVGETPTTEKIRLMLVLWLGYAAGTVYGRVGAEATAGTFCDIRGKFWLKKRAEERLNLRSSPYTATSTAPDAQSQLIKAPRNPIRPKRAKVGRQRG